MRFTRKILILALGSLIGIPSVLAQFSSGSTGTDGAYSPTASGNFDPAALGLDPSGDNVFNFTTINIPSGVTINLLAGNLRNKAVTWLATGNVTIAGTLNLSGASEGQVTVSSAGTPTGRAQTEPGPGGYAGGVGSQGGVGPEAGAGPGGGPAGLQSGNGQACYGGNASFITAGYTYTGQQAAPTYGSYLLVPLYGGSGGGGGWDNASGNNVGGTGGAGGGAIRIASSTQINVTGTINANGGSFGTVSGSTAGCQGGAGSGGAIHLVAPTILGNGSLTAYVPSYGPSYGQGIIRFSTTTNSFTGNTTPAFIQSALYLPPANSTLPLPSLTITQVNGVAVSAEANGQILNPDVVISASNAVTVNLAASNIPLGTIVSLRVTAQFGADTTISCKPLAGTLAASTATCSATFPFAISIADVRATW
jgi:hypothetical protein